MREPIGTEGPNILGVIQSALALRSHRDLFLWLQRDVRAFLPHEILIAAWGDFASGQVSYDLVSPLPGMRTTEISREELLPLLMEMFDAWVDSECLPFSTEIGGISLDGSHRTSGTDAVWPIARLRGAVVHGIRDERGWYDCLYVALCVGTIAEPEAVEAMGLLLPYIDAAFRKLAHLPMQREGLARVNAEAQRIPAAVWSGAAKGAESGLSEREQEIMRWVCVGKTNPEIGLILSISPRTVRNHLQRIFRKLDVINRAQAVFQLEQAANIGENG